MRKLTPPQIVLLSFGIAILCATLLLSLPVATKSGNPLSPIDSLFTATSATCVTGLIVKDTGRAFSLFGQIVILLFIQLGGLGIMTFSTLFSIILAKRLTISQDLTIKNALGYDKIEGLRGLIKYIVLIAFVVEFIGATLLYLRWSFITQWSQATIFKRAIFHSISAFCNAGFSLFSNSLTNWRADTAIMAIMGSLIIIGGLGFVVVLNIPKLGFYVPFFRRAYLARQIKKGIANPFVKKINLQTKTVLAVTIILLLIGMAGVFLLECNYILKDMPLKEKFLSSIFTAITPRTAGFNVLPTGDLQTTTKFLLMILIFIGASPGSTGGGIKTATVAVLLVGFVSMLKGRDRIFIFKRTIERDVFRRAVAIFVLAITLIFTSTLLLTITEKAVSGDNGYFLSLFFETTSAFGTCGLTTGVTPHLSTLGKLIVAITMFIGRIGPLTVALALAMRVEKKIYYRYPEEKITVG
ncbi:MAG: Trk family potassium uptake protein [Candidatus Omnitrophota bacterium]|nr:MAG: Trk family potassium uptake protein [Candidatus Omnitrophota bacterium]